MKREVPLFVTATIGLFMILSFFVPHHVVSVPADFLQQCAVIVVAFGYVLGGANALRVNFDLISKKAPNWQYKIVLIVSLATMVVVGAAEGRRFQDPATTFTWLYDRLYVPMQATMFALLAFFIASAAFRAFRVRTVEAGLLATAALIVMVGRVPIGDEATKWVLNLPSWMHWMQLPSIQEWILSIPQNAAKRAILIGAALGVMATGLRVILGIERSYLSGEG
jgi:hypothetical protein